MSLKATLVASAAGLLASAAALAGDGTTIVNRSALAGGGASYWTAERLAAAKPMRVTRNDGLSAESWGTSILDFTRGRFYPSASINKQKPNRFIGKLYFTIPGSGDFQCSASVIGKRLIVTAAHCMNSGSGFYTNWTFIPAFNGAAGTLAAQRPYGTWDWAYGKISPTWITTAAALPNNADFGILELVDQSFGGGAPQTIGKKLGGNLAIALDHLSDTHITAVGYPCNFDSCNLQERVDSGDHRPGSTAAGNNAFEYGSDMTGGSSGGPWIENFGDPTSAAPQGNWNVRNAVTAVTSYGYTDPAVLVQGASAFNSADFKPNVLDPACAHKAGNC